MATKDLRIKIKIDGDYKDIKTARKQVNELGRAFSNTDTVANSLKATIGKLAIVGASLSTIPDMFKSAIRSMDEFKNASGRLKLVTSNLNELKNAQNELFKISNQSRVGFATSIETYARLSRSLKELNPSQEKLLSVTEAINKSLIVSGANASSAEAALIQLGQGLASGALRGQELMSVLEQTPRLAEAIATGMGVSVGKLKELGEQGALTSQAVFNALLSQREAIKKEFAQMPVTVSSSLSVLKNQITNSLSGVDSFFSITEKLSSSIIFLGENLGTLSRLLISVGVTFGAYKLSANKTIRELYRLSSTTTTASIATGTLTKKIGFAKAGMNMFKLSIKGVKTAFKSFFPAVALFGTLELFSTLLSSTKDEAQDLGDTLATTSKELEKLTKNQLLYRESLYNAQYAQLLKERADLRVDIANDGFFESDEERLADKALYDEKKQQIERIKELLKEIDTLKGKYTKDGVKSITAPLDTKDVDKWIEKTSESLLSAKQKIINETNALKADLNNKLNKTTNEQQKNILNEKLLELERVKNEKLKSLEEKASRDTLKTTQKTLKEKAKLLESFRTLNFTSEQKATDDVAKYSENVYKYLKDDLVKASALIEDFAQKRQDRLSKQLEEEKEQQKRHTLELQNLEIKRYEDAGNYADAWRIKSQQVADALVNVDANKAKQMFAITRAEYYDKLKEEDKKRLFSYGKLQGIWADGLKFHEQFNTTLKSDFENAIDLMSTATNSLQSNFESFFDHQSKNFLDFGKLAKSVINDIGKQIIKQQIVAPLAKSGSSFFSGLLGSASEGLAGALFGDSRGGFKLFADGGYTANVGVREVAGVVHGGEYVVPNWQVKQNRTLIQALEAQRLGKRGFISGGYTMEDVEKEYQRNPGISQADRDMAFDAAKRFGFTTKDREDKNFIKDLTKPIYNAVNNTANIIKNAFEFLQDPLKGFEKLGKEAKEFDFNSVLKEGANFLMDTLGSMIGASLGSGAGILGVAGGGYLGKHFMDTIQEYAFGWKDGDPSKKKEALAKAYEESAKLTKEISNSLDENTLGAKNTLKNMSKIFKTQSEITRLEYKIAKDKEDRVETSLSTIKELEAKKVQLAKDKAQQRTANEQDVIRNVSMLYKDIFGVNATIKEKIDAPLQKLFKKYSEIGNEAFTKVLVDGSLVDSRDVYSIWKKYAKKQKKEVDVTIQEAFKNVMNFREDFTKWKLKDNALALAKYNSQLAQKTFQAQATKMGVKFAELTADNFLDKYNQAIANSFDPQVLENWNTLSNAFKQASDAQTNYTNAIMASANALAQEKINLANAMGVDSYNFTRKMYADQIRNIIAKKGYEIDVDYYVSDFKSMIDEKDTKKWDKWYDDKRSWFNKWLGYSEQDTTTLMSALQSLASLEKQRENAQQNSSNTNISSWSPVSTSYSNWGRYDFYDKITKNEQQLTDAIKEIGLTKRVEYQDRYGRTRYKNEYLKFSELTEEILKDKMNALHGRSATNEKISKVTSALGLLEEALSSSANNIKNSLKFDFYKRITPKDEQIQKAIEDMGLTKTLRTTTRQVVDFVNKSTNEVLSQHELFRRIASAKSPEQAAALQHSFTRRNRTITNKEQVALTFKELTKDILTDRLRELHGTNATQEEISKVNNALSILEEALRDNTKTLEKMNLTTLKDTLSGFKSIEATSRSFIDNIMSKNKTFVQGNYKTALQQAQSLMDTIRGNSYTLKQVKEFENAVKKASEYGNSYFNNKSYENEYQERFERTVAAHQFAEIEKTAQKEQKNIGDVVDQLEKLRKENKELSTQNINIQQQLLDVQKEIVLLQKEA